MGFDTNGMVHCHGNTPNPKTYIKSVVLVLVTNGMVHCRGNTPNPKTYIKSIVLVLVSMELIGTKY